MNTICCFIQLPFHPSILFQSLSLLAQSLGFIKGDCPFIYSFLSYAYNRQSLSCLQHPISFFFLLLFLKLLCINKQLISVKILDHLILEKLVILGWKFLLLKKEMNLSPLKNDSHHECEIKEKLSIFWNHKRERMFLIQNQL